MTVRAPALIRLGLALLAGGMAPLLPAAPPAGNDDAFLDDVQARTFRWFWEQTNPANGLVPDRTPHPPFCSIGAVGFGLTAYGVGTERGWVSRAAATARVRTTLRFLAQAPMGPEPAGVSGDRGFFYHFLTMAEGHRHRTNELSSIDTALLMMGVLFCREYFDRPDPEETEIRELADRLYRRVEWSWMATRPLWFGRPLLRMAWRPERGFSRAVYEGMDEAMFLYLLAIGSPTHPIGPAAWDNFTRTYQWGEFHGQEYVQFGPLFGYQYAHVWIDPRGLQDAALRARRIDYCENSRRATLANRAYCQANPGGFRDYSGEIWGLSACDGPADVKAQVGDRVVRFSTYAARGASLRGGRDDGTITPAAPGGSVPFAPEIAIPALRAMQARYGALLYNEYGFLDAFNPTYRAEFGPVQRGVVDPGKGWFDASQLGIDQGPILLMIENHRSGFIWQVMRRSPYLTRGLALAGFTAGWLDTPPAAGGE